MNTKTIISTALFACMLTSPALAAPLTYESCGQTVSIEDVPQRAITLNQQATEVMLALGLEDHMVGTAYLEDQIPAQWQDAYNQVPVIAKNYPAKEVVLIEEPDFLFAGFASAFAEKNVGTQQEWNDRGVATYLVNASCDQYNPKNVPVTTAPILKDIEVIGQIFDVQDRAQKLMDETAARIEKVQALNPGAGRTAFFYDSDDDPVYTAGCCGSPALLMRILGLESITDEIEGRWVNVSWEHIVQQNPEIIVINDAVWSPAGDKIEKLKTDPVLSNLKAVQQERFLIIPFSQTVLGMRFTDGVENLARQIEELDQ
ncbi:ABC transporter substrate-binding protein [Maritalea mediterranea]|uniref:ABC transporter substrate-binding protein n=1 Tax=Maritalea mediterranea TaxID=2909667 RepID=A0ABS9ECP4_9HYPH|nr:ABC transporter substrate-binding protein [Maritalea mediterranea]MCF4099226.1 ABC transporter substrate-binding protein [Maritalea mediterranea]